MSGSYTSDHIQSVFDKAVIEAFDSLAFMEVRRAEMDEMPEPDDSWRWASVALVAPITGKVVFSCSEDILAEIAGNLFE